MFSTSLLSRCSHSCHSGAVHVGQIAAFGRLSPRVTLRKTAHQANEPSTNLNLSLLAKKCVLQCSVYGLSFLISPPAPDPLKGDQFCQLLPFVQRGYAPRLSTCNSLLISSSPARSDVPAHCYPIRPPWPEGHTRLPEKRSNQEANPRYGNLCISWRRLPSQTRLTASAQNLRSPVPPCLCQGNENCFSRGATSFKPFFDNNPSWLKTEGVSRFQR